MANPEKVKIMFEAMAALDEHLDGGVLEGDWVTLLMAVKAATLRDLPRQELAQAIGRFDALHSLRARAERTTLARPGQPGGPDNR
jgi:hypothetical protein